MNLVCVFVVCACVYVCVYVNRGIYELLSDKPKTHEYTHGRLIAHTHHSQTNMHTCTHKSTYSTNRVRTRKYAHTNTHTPQTKQIHTHITHRHKPNKHTYTLHTDTDTNQTNTHTHLYDFLIAWMRKAASWHSSDLCTWREYEGGREREERQRGREKKYL